MVEWYWWVGGSIVTIFVLLLWEESRDWLSETFSYIIEFEWLSDAWEGIIGIFEGIGEFSVYGLTFGILTTGVLFLLSKWTLAPFLVYYDTTGKITWTIITYVGTFIAGYLMGKGFENTG